MEPLLLFHAELRDSNRLIDGRLLLIDKNSNKEIERYIATSGQVGWQDDVETDQRGRGALPSPDDVGIDCYFIDTAPVHLPHVKGVEGNFYKILPFQVKTRSGRTRSDFGIHWDGNTPGSAGCIVIRNKPAWQAFDARIAGLRSKFKQIPLMVSYARG